MRSRFWPFAQVLLLALSVAVVPSCTSNKTKAAPQIVSFIPAPGLNTGISLMPNIVYKFDQAMNPTFMNNPAYFGIFPGTSGTSVGVSCQYLPELNEVRIWPQALLVADTDYTVVVSGLVESEAGTPLGSNLGPCVFHTVTAAANSTTSLISWAGFTAVTGATNPGDIDLNISPAQESPSGGGGLATVAATYFIYVTSTADAQDLMFPEFTTALASGAVTINMPLAATVYHVKVQPRDSSGAAVVSTFTDVQVTSK